MIAAVLLLHERSVDEITPQLSAPELEQVINLVDRNPRLTIDDLVGMARAIAGLGERSRPAG